MVKCPFCNEDMKGPRTQLLTTDVVNRVVVTTVRKTYNCAPCRVAAEQIVEVRTDIL